MPKPRLNILKLGGSLFRETNQTSSCCVSPVSNASASNSSSAKTPGVPTFSAEISCEETSCEATGVQSNPVPPIRDWLAQWSSGHGPSLIVLGGGQAVDEIRQRQIQQGLRDEDAHWQAIQVMRDNAVQFASELELPTVEFCNFRSPLPAANLPLAVAIIRDSYLPTQYLPADWTTTSDSIALWLAVQLRARRLILAKRTNPLEPLIDCGKMRGLGWVDPQFHRLLRQIGWDGARKIEHPLRGPSQHQLPDFKLTEPVKRGDSGLWQDSGLREADVQKSWAQDNQDRPSIASPQTIPKAQNPTNGGLSDVLACGRGSKHLAIWIRHFCDRRISDASMPQLEQVSQNEPQVPAAEGFERFWTRLIPTLSAKHCR